MIEKIESWGVVGFNPCYNGLLIRTQLYIYIEKQKKTVSILVIMDY